MQNTVDDQYEITKNQYLKSRLTRQIRSKYILFKLLFTYQEYKIVSKTMTMI
jgi:hypothetical protein